MKLELRIALRYLLWRGSFNFISIITYISLIGIIIGVAALIIVMAIFNGFGEFAKQQLIAYDPHIKISAKSGAWINNSDSLLNALRNYNEVNLVAPIISGRAVAMNKSNLNALFINGVKQSEINSISGIPNSIIRGNFNISLHLGYPGLVIGSGLQKRLDLNINDTVEIVTPNILESSIKTYKKKSGKIFIITGIFQTNTKDYDDLLAYTSINNVQELFDTPSNSITSFDIRLKNIEDVDKVIASLQKSLSDDYNIQSWFDLHKDLYRIMQFERYSAFIILCLVIIIALFNLLASLSMIVVTKQPDIALLKAIGLNNISIKKIFTQLGLIIGSFGTVFGILLAYWAYTIYQNPDITKIKIFSSNPFVDIIYFSIMNIASNIINLLSLDTDKYLLNKVPMTLDLWDIVAVACVTILISFIVTIYPSRRASKIVVSQSIRNE